jgi:hypothetical protein
MEWLEPFAAYCLGEDPFIGAATESEIDTSLAGTLISEESSPIASWAFGREFNSSDDRL